MAISSVGIGSGLEVETIVKQLVALESKPIAALQTKATGINTQISAFSQLKSQISNLQDQVDKLAKPATWLGNTLTSSNSTQVTGTATSSAVQATYDVEVSQMAAGQTIGSGLVTSGTTLGPGKLTISMGTYGANGLTPNTKDGKNVSFRWTSPQKMTLWPRLQPRSMPPRAMSAPPCSRTTRASAWCCNPRPRA
jgi:flagellar hook-associated protein 2